MGLLQTETKFYSDKIKSISLSIMEVKSNIEAIVKFPEGKELTTVKEVIKSLGFKGDLRLELNEACPKGVNFMATVYQVVVINHNTSEQLIKLILKCSKRDIKLRERPKYRDDFLREAFAYETILPEFEIFQRDKNIIEFDQFKKYPTCYKTCLELNDEFIILEDLKMRNFMMNDCKKHLNFSHCKMVIHQLAKFHAISFAYKHQNPDKFKALSKYCEPRKIKEWNILDEEGKNRKQTVYNEIALKILEKDCKYHEKFQQILYTKGLDVLLPVIHQQDEFQILCHGDFWNNNILFQYQQDDYDKKSPNDIRFLDWQCLSVNSPITDLSYFIYGCTTEDTRKLYFDTLLKLYYDSLANYMKKLGSDPKVVYPYITYQENIKKYFKYGVVRMIDKLINYRKHAENESIQQNCESKKNGFSDSPFENNYRWCKSMVQASLKHAIDCWFI